MRHPAILLVLLVVTSRDVAAHPKARSNSSVTPQRGGAPATLPRISLSPRFLPGETFRYQMVFETSTATARSGLAADPQGPSSQALTWNAAIRLDVLPAQTAGQRAQGAQGAQGEGGIRLRITYEKSAAAVRSDTFDPNAAATEDQYRKLEGKVIEFALDANGKVTSVSGLEQIVDGEKAIESARTLIDQFAAGPGAPAGGVTVGQKWASEQAATSLPFAGMVWRTESEYLREDACPQTNPGGAPAPSGAVAPNPEADANPERDERCAVIETHLNLIRPNAVRDPTSEEFHKNEVRTAGSWTGSIDSLSYVSLRTGLVVRMTQTGTQDMDVTLTNEHNDSLRYSGTIRSRSQVALVAGDPSGK